MKEKIKFPNKVIGWTLCLAFLATCTITVVNETRNEIQSRKSWTESINQFEMNPVNYVAYYRAMKAQNPDLDAIGSVFFDEQLTDQEYYEPGEWDNYIAHYDLMMGYNPNIYYTVYDNNSKSLLTSSQEAALLKEYPGLIQKDDNQLSATWSQEMQNEYGYYSVISYDENGAPTILDCFGKDTATMVTAMKPINQQEKYKVPVYERIDNELTNLIEESDDSFEYKGKNYIIRGETRNNTGIYYYYESEETVQDQVGEEENIGDGQGEELRIRAYRMSRYIYPSSIKNVTIVVALSEPFQNGPGYHFFYMEDGYSDISEGIMFLLKEIIIAVCIGALIMASIKSLGVAIGIVTKIPFEVVGVAIAGVVWMIKPMGYMTQSHAKGYLLKELLASNSEGIAYFSDFIVIYGGWFLFFAVIFFGIISILSVFRKGIKRYCLENVFTVRFLIWLAKLCNEGMDRFMKIDYHSSINIFSMKIAFVAFLFTILMCAIWIYGKPLFFIGPLLIFLFLRRYLSKLKRQYDQSLNAARSMAEGQLDCKIEEDLGFFAPLASELNKIQDGFKQAVSEEVKSQKMKTELITNVSHDLKTPLTAIITYINLLKEENITKEQQKEYIEVLDSKSMRLKRLIEDLFEVSKINSSNITLDPVDVDVVELIKQAQLELADRFEQAKIEYRLAVPEEKIILHLDSQKTYRIFENLFVNVVKYAQPGTRAYMTVTEHNEDVTFELKNVSAQELNIQPEQLTERFVRGDQSRNSEGSGLGLAIVKSIVELQGGKFKIEIDGDLFKAIIQFHAS